MPQGARAGSWPSHFYGLHAKSRKGRCVAQRGRRRNDGATHGYEILARILPIHPAAELFSCAPVSPDEKRALGEDIIKDGLTSPIVLWKPDRKSPECLLDGITRLDVIEIATGRPVIVGAPSITAGEDFLACNKVIVLDGSVDPYAYVISANIRRRHLTTEQKRDLIAKLIKADRASPIGRSPSRRRPTTRRSHSQSGEGGSWGNSPRPTRIDTKGRKQPAKRSKRKTSTPPHVLEKRAAAAERICALMGKTRDGAALHRDLSSKAERSWLTDGTPVRGDVAALIIARPAVVGVGDALPQFPGEIHGASSGNNACNALLSSKGEWR